MISTRNFSALPDAAALQRLCKSLAVLDAINSPDWEYRYYSYNPQWGEGETLFEMRDGEGDQMLVLFRAEGCCISGYLHEYEQPDKTQVTRGLPAAFDEFMFGEPVNSIGTTFCLWYTPAHGWQTGLPAAEDGSDELLFIFDGQPETYTDWANEYFVEDSGRKLIDGEAVAAIYRGEAVTKPLVRAITDELDDWGQLATDLQEIGYPYQLA
ncbi:hypothetical protein [Hymenobacter sp. B81]|uniref:hypothetical protein n=1 Tax=Hymenobacter sp. B81 TaxID=3344878 RepID=UPI0037DCC42A